jgi:hypothetical protein
VAGSGSKMGWKIAGTGSAILAGVLTRKLLTKTWTSITGNEPPSNPEHPEVTWPEAISWAVLSGVAVALARLVATRTAADRWVKATGSLPPGLEETSA